MWKKDKGGGMMERLTKRTVMGIVGNNASIKNYPLYKVAQYDELDRGITGQCFDKLAEYEDFEEIFREKMTDTACEFLKDKEEFGKWLDRKKWIAKKCDEYARAEEQGLLLRLPVKPGDIVYIISTARRFHNEIIPLKVHGIDIRKDDFAILAKNEKYCGYSISTLFGKNESVDWFLTKEEAEQKLKEMESD